MLTPHQCSTLQSQVETLWPAELCPGGLLHLWLSQPAKWWRHRGVGDIFQRTCSGVSAEFLHCLCLPLSDTCCKAKCSLLCSILSRGIESGAVLCEMH